jgi:hypothetical protein
MPEHLKKYVEILSSFFKENTENESYNETFDTYWDELRCELFFETDRPRGEFPSGHAMPDTYFLLIDFSDTLHDLPSNYESIAREIDSLSSGRILESIFICDRTSDGEPGSAQWEAKV